MRPVFLSEDVRIEGKPRIVGNNHLVLAVKQNNSDKVFDTIGFNMGEYYNVLSQNHCEFDIVYNIDRSSRNGTSFPQFRIKDIKIKENQQE
jgi:single-stranded-DNA-specific exonuclease